MTGRSPTDRPDPELPEGRRAAGTAGRLGVVLVVGVVAVTGGVLAVRTWSVLQFRRPSTVGLAGVSDLIMAMLTLLALGAGALAWWGRARGGARWLLAATIPFAILTQTTWPTTAGLVRPEHAVNGVPLRIVAQNLWQTNPDRDAAARTVLSMDADVLVLTEVTSRHLGALQRAGAEEDYPFRVVRPRPDTKGMAVFSKVPFRAGRQSSLFRTEVVLRPSGGRPVDLIAVHMPSATRAGVEGWTEAYAELARVVAERGPDLVVAGDFNANSGMVPFRHLVAVGGLRDAQDVAGGGFRPTWSEVATVPVLRLDHVLVGPAIGVSGFGFLPPIRSDHRGVVADLRIPDAP